MLIIISILLAGIIMLVGVLLLLRPGKPAPLVDENGRPLAGSLSEKIHVNINGVEQGMFVPPEAVTLHSELEDMDRLRQYFQDENIHANVDGCSCFSIPPVRRKGTGKDGQYRCAPPGYGWP